MLGALLGNYRVVKQLGEGGMGVVYVGRHETLSRQVVVKVLRPEMSRSRDMLQRFFNEAQAATAIRNPGIVQVFDFGTTPDGSAFIVMELLEGESLKARLARRRLDTAQCCRIARQIANVLQAAHEAGITHRDLKPDNLFLIPDVEVLGGERVKVLDFGIAKLAGELHAAGVRTDTGVMMGTPSYMSPEQCRSAVTAEPRSDIYSLGCILFEMVCGRTPFSSAGAGVGDIIGAHLHVPPPHPHTLAPATPPALAALILHLLAKRPSQRPQTMAAVSQRLDEILHTLGSAPPPAAEPFPEPDPTLVSIPASPALPAPAPGPDLPTIPARPARPARPAAGAPALSPAPRATAPFAGAAPLPPSPVSPQLAPLAAASPPAPAVSPSPQPARSPALGPAPAAAPPAPAAAPPAPAAAPPAPARIVALALPPPRHPREPRSSPRPYVIGGVLAAFAVTTAAIALSTDDDPPSASPPPLSSPPPSPSPPSPSPPAAAPSAAAPPAPAPRAPSPSPTSPPSASPPSAAPPAPSTPSTIAAVSLPSSPPPPQPRPDAAPLPAVATAAPRPIAAAVPGPVADRPQPAAAPTTKQPLATPSAADLALECRRSETARQWDALGRCAERLKPLDPQRAAALQLRASEELKAAPRIASIHAALRARDLKRASAELAQLWPQATGYASTKRSYDLAEAQAITDLAEKLTLARSPDCKGHTALLTNERLSQPPRVVTEAARHAPCSPQPCIADAYADKGQAQYAQGQLATALASYEAAYACRPTPQWAEKAFIIACNLADLPKARLYWRQLSPPLRSRALPICERNGLSAPTLNAP